MVSVHRTRQDLAQVLHDLVDVHYPNAEKIVLVFDNLNTHDFSALYETFEPEEAWRIREKIEIHSTPKHGSWLNMAEIELAVLGGQCLDRRIGEESVLQQEVAAWEAECNAKPGQSQLALYSPGCANEAQAALPCSGEGVRRCLTDL